MPRQQARHRNTKGDAEVIACATEILARRCCGESVKKIHADLKRRKAVTSCYGTFQRWVFKMETNQLEVPMVPEYLKLRGVLQGTGPVNAVSPVSGYRRPAGKTPGDLEPEARIRKVVG